jgi:hypothetical protein
VIMRSWVHLQILQAMHANACVQMVNETLKQASQMRACLFAC